MHPKTHHHHQYYHHHHPSSYRMEIVTSQNSGANDFDGIN